MQWILVKFLIVALASSVCIDACGSNEPISILNRLKNIGFRCPSYIDYIKRFYKTGTNTNTNTNTVRAEETNTNTDPNSTTPTEPPQKSGCPSSASVENLVTNTIAKYPNFRLYLENFPNS